ncbi:glutamate-5-semialdehyde dehydrogenase [Rheinheimera sp.]|jgi:glutamate-5-semialdehyde dehydrogenase|uniref:glutamate-5-semialdehyde dehydrogenase n=1 Tax=Rheinheimera sp. TaxID=1869214 RepID=UPI00261EAC30|nr:glutamate-5-semialdehyde dehydrogenase [Rheinheimera sp.]MCA1931353.1 glutamate-5-semialdehyde dehydrogenase [Rheinheimera sp.]
MTNIKAICQQAKIAALQLAQLSEADKNLLLLAMADQLEADTALILAGNAKDMAAGREKQLAEAMLDRLLLTEDRIKTLANAVRYIAALPDPVGQIRQMAPRPNGIQVGKMRIPLGVIAMIYEARPNVTADAGALCLKSGNAVILRGGREALNSSLAIAASLHKAMEKQGINPAAISVIPDPDRALLLELLQQKDSVDLVIPRGGEGLIHFVSDNSKIPVIQHYKGICHLYVDKAADLDKAMALLLNGKTQRPGVCNALETLLVHQAIAPQFLALAAQGLEEKQVEVFACDLSLPYFTHACRADEAQFDTEYLRLAISVKTVADYDDAVSHIQRHSSGHTEVICTQDISTAQRFLKQINSAVVMVNASSRFSDGGELGLGAEIGISTSKLHAYGPMGLESLTTEKYIVIGDGQTR